VLVDDVLVDSATHSNDLTMGDGVFHLGYFGAVGTSVTTNINVSAVAAPAVSTATAPIYIGQGNILVTATDVPASTNYGATVDGEDATFVVRSGDAFVFKLTTEIDALTANDPADDPDVSGYLVRIWYGD
jgi:uridylate kinase